MSAETPRVRLVSWERSTSRNEYLRGTVSVVISPLAVSATVIGQLVISGITVSRRFGPIRLGLPLRLVFGPDGRARHNKAGRMIWGPAVALNLEAEAALADAIEALVEARDPGALAPLPPPQSKPKGDPS